MKCKEWKTLWGYLVYLTISKLNILYIFHFYIQSVLPSTAIAWFIAYFAPSLRDADPMHIWSQDNHWSKCNRFPYHYIKLHRACQCIPPHCIPNATRSLLLLEALAADHATPLQAKAKLTRIAKILRTQKPCLT